MPSNSDSGSGFQPPTRMETGYYIVSWKDNFVHWLAWASWLYREFGKTYFSERMTVWDKWPPIDGAMAALVISELKDARKAANEDRKIHGPILGEINNAPHLWEPWPAEEIHRLARDEARRRSAIDNKFDHKPRYVWDDGPVAPLHQIAAA